MRLLVVLPYEPVLPWLPIPRRRRFATGRVCRTRVSQVSPTAVSLGRDVGNLHWGGKGERVGGRAVIHAGIDIVVVGVVSGGRVVGRSGCHVVAASVAAGAGVIGAESGRSGVGQDAVAGGS